MRNFAQIKLLINNQKPKLSESKTLPERVGREIYRMGVKFQLAQGEARQGIQAALTLLNSALSLAVNGDESEAMRLIYLARKLGNLK